MDEIQKKEGIELNEMKEIALIFYKSGLFSDLKSEAQAVVKVMAGKEWGFEPFFSMQHLAIQKGKISLDAQAISRLIENSKRYRYKIIEHTNEICSIQFYEIREEKIEEIGISSFSIEDAKKAGLLVPKLDEHGRNFNLYDKYPRNMLFARALSNGGRWFCPGINIPYTSEEIEELPEIAEKSSIKMPEPASDMKPIEIQINKKAVEEIQEGKQRIELPKGESENVTSFLDQSIQEIQKISEDWIDKLEKGKPNIIISKEDEELYTEEWAKGLTPEIVTEIEADSIEMSDEEKEMEAKKWMEEQEAEKKEKETPAKTVDFHYANQCRQFKGIVGEKVYYDLLNTYGRAKHSTDLKGASKIKFLRTIKELAIKAGWKEEENG